MAEQPNIVIINYGIGNTHSVSNAIRTLGYKKVLISDNEGMINKADVLILPGVGAFEEAINNLRSRKLDSILNENVLLKGKPILGICVGMQLLATSSEENGGHFGLNWIEGTVKKLKLPSEFSVPHVGWNNIVIKNKAPLFSENLEFNNFYFDHSYHFVCDESNIMAYCDYGINVTAAVQ